MIEPRLDKLFVEAQLYELVIVRLDAIHAPEVRADSDHLDVGQLEYLGIEVQHLVPDNAFTQFTHLDHYDHLMDGSAPCCGTVERMDRGTTRIDRDVGVPDDMICQIHRRGLQIHGANLGSDLFDRLQSRNPRIGHGVDIVESLIEEQALKDGTIAAQKLCNQGPLDIMPTQEVVQLPNISQDL